MSRMTRPLGLCVRGGDGDAREIPIRQDTEDLFRDDLPWPTFRWYYGQQHYSGSYWAATMAAHVIYDSRLELARLLTPETIVWDHGKIYVSEHLNKHHHAISKAAATYID